MELNERIFAERKKAGLSQEELANKLDVSRQAVGKWENGTATPDINNLMALSEALEVPIGELLGESAPEQKENSPEYITREELKKFFAEQESANFRHRVTLEEKTEKDRKDLREENRLHRKWTYMTISALAIAIVIICFIGANKISSLNEELSNMDRENTDRFNNVLYEIRDMEGDITNMLKKQASLFSMYDYDVTDYNADTGEVTVSLSVTPKSVTDTMEMMLVLTKEGDGSELTFDTERSGGSFAAEILMPGGGYYTVTAIIEDSGVSQKEELAGFSASPVGLMAEYYYDWITPVGLQWCERREDAAGWDFTYEGLISVNCNKSSLPARKLKQVTVTLYKNDEMLETINLDGSDSAFWYDEYSIPEVYQGVSSTHDTGLSAGKDGYLFVGDFSFDVSAAQKGDIFRVVMELTDTLGLKYGTGQEDIIFGVSTSGPDAYVSTASSSAGHISIMYELYN